MSEFPTPEPIQSPHSQSRFQTLRPVAGLVALIVIGLGILALLPAPTQQEPAAIMRDAETSEQPETTRVEDWVLVTSPLTSQFVTFEVTGISRDPSVLRVIIENLDNGRSEMADIKDSTWAVSTANSLLQVGVNHLRAVPGYDRPIGRDNSRPYDFTITITGIPVLDTEVALAVDWLEQPAKIADYSFVDSEKLQIFERAREGGEAQWIYKIGTVRSGPYDAHDLYIFSTGACDPGIGCDSRYYRALKDPSSGALRFLEAHSEELFSRELGLFDEVLSQATIPALGIPVEFNLNNLRFHAIQFGSFSAKNEGWFFERELIRIGTHPEFGALYTDPAPLAEDSSALQAFYIRLPDSRIRAYTFTPPFVSDNRIPQVAWDDKTQNTTDYQWGDMGGCGATNQFAVRSARSLRPGERLIRAGTTSTGDTVFTLRDPEDQELRDIYENYRPYKVEGEESMPYETFVARRPIFYWQDPFDRWIRFTRTDNLSAVECGKPVIYLYPEREMSVSVRVGLHGIMTKSEPAHGSRGWRVMAQPDGFVKNLTDGETYPNLFWEGTGVNYRVPKQGFVVKTVDADAWFAQTLAEIGFTDRESAEFREFWVPRMPKTPYAFVTFVPQVDFDRDAPLFITPYPDHVYRVFMEYRGLAESIVVEPLALPKIVRNGFTVVEWGGALR